MDRLLFFFITDALTSLFWPSLLPFWCLPALLFCGFLCFKKHWVVAAGTCAGLIWMLSVGYWLELTQPTKTLFSNRIVITGEVVSVVTEFDKGKFDFVTEQVLHKEQLIWRKAHHKLRLSWHKPEFELAQGQKLQLEVKLKPRWGLANEAGFDYQQWQLTNNIVATGYVVDSERHLLLSQNVSWRQKLASKIVAIQAPEVRWLLALGIGYRSALNDEDWQLLQRTGTSHLVAISGMHLGMVALWSYVFFTLLFSLIRSIFNVNRLSNIRTAAMTASLFPCGCYALLAGLSVPTLRAMLMLLLAWFLIKFRLNWRLHRFVLVSIAAFILIFPLSIFGISFWLSFSAILTINFILWRFPLRVNDKTHFTGDWKSKILYFFKIQMGVTSLMIPLVLLLFGGASLISPVVNILAVPLVTLVLLPGSLLVLLLISLEKEFLYPVLNGLLRLFQEAELALSWAANLPFAWQDIGTSGTFSVILAAIGMILMLLPQGILPRSLYLLLVLPLASSFSQYRSEQWQLDVLDVGQGLAVLIRKEGHAIVYDTGAAFPSGFSMAKAVILPVLKKSNVNYLDKLIISHDDNDHAGGLEVIREALPVADYIHSPETCRVGAGFNWRGLRFEVLWPHEDYPQMQKVDNNLSCVIRISDGHHSVLLAGDIEYSVERILVHLHRQKQINLQSEFLIVPHHGSKTSSTSSFISAVSPQYGLVSAGFRNRWRMPAAEVLERYKAANVKLLNTAETGQIRLVFSPERSPEVSVWRINHRLRWFLRPWQE